MHLNCHSYYSLRYGTSSPLDLVEAAANKGIQTLALTDINNTSAAYPFVNACREKGIKPILGIEFRNGNRLLFIGIAQNREGFRQLNTLLSQHSFEDKELPEIPEDLPDVYLIYPRRVKDLADFKENEFLGIRPEYLNRLFGKSILEYPDKLLAWTPVTLLNSSQYTTHKILRAIDQNTLISKLKPGTYAKANELLYAPKELEKAYAAYPFLLENTKRLLTKCQVKLDASVRNNRHCFTSSSEEDFKLLEKLTFKGVEERYGLSHSVAFARAEKELKMIKKQGYCPYFLITWDTVQFAASKNYHYVGRGSGANSIVAYALRITDVDPLLLNLPFERFINEFRSSPPDFDVDFSWDERDDVLDYIFERYGRAHSAMLATYVTFRGRSVIRELGKVFGLPKFEIDKIIADPLNKREHHELAALILKEGRNIEGMPNYLSMHAGGVIISEEPLHYFTAMKMMPKGFPITHFNMYDGEDLGFHKFDILSQRGLGHLKETVSLVKKNQAKEIDIHRTAEIMQNEEVRSQLRSAHCMGCFYIESPAMRGLLSKLKCDDYLGLVAASSIIRPGVAQSGMMQAYIKRKHDPQSFKYLDPVFEDQLRDTYGVMVYQEDVMKIANAFAGLPMDECDVLRRIMSGKKAKGDTFERLREKYFAGCKEKGHTRELAEEVWRQIASFAGYSFCKAHSASYAVESFQSLYLKTYFPLEFMVGVINNFGGFYRMEYYFHEAQMCGASIHAPCINKSDVLTNIKGTDIYVGFIHIQGMERELSQRIVANREKMGPFLSLEDFLNRIDIGTEQLDLLIRINAFRFTGANKYQLIWQKNGLLSPKTKFEYTGRLFPLDKQTFDLPDLQEYEFDQAFDEIELLGFPLRSPFELLSDRGQLDKTFVANDLPDLLGKTIDIIGYYVCRKQTHTKYGQLMNFGTWLDQEGRLFDTTHFPPVLKQYPLKGKGIYRISGKVVSEFGFPSIEVLKTELLPLIQDRRYA